MTASQLNPQDPAAIAYKKPAEYSVSYLRPLEGGILKYSSDLKQCRVKFREWQPEALLNQAADILDRAVRTRTEWFNLRIQLSALQLEANADAFEMAKAERESLYLDAQLSNLRLQIESESSVAQYKSNARGELQAAAESFPERSGDSRAAVRAENFGRYNAAAAYDQAQADVALWASQVRDKDIVKDQVTGAKLTADDRKNFLKDQREEKAKLQAEGGPLYLGPRIDALLNQFTEDFKDAYDRLSVAAKGMRERYGYDPQDLPLPVIDDKLEESKLDAVIRWQRRATRYLIAFQQQEQAFTVQWSLARSLGVNALQTKESAGTTGLGSHKVQLYKFEFVIPEAQLESHTSIRLRGVSVFVASSDENIDGDGLACVLYVPSDSKVEHANSDGGIYPVDVNQAPMPPIYIGSLGRRQSIRAPEVVGTVSATNASPHGPSPWKLTLMMPEAYNRSNIKDLQIDFSFVGRPRAAGA